VIVYDLKHDDCHRIVVTRHQGLYKNEDWYMGFTNVDKYMFECCLKDLSGKISSSTVIRDFRARRRLLIQCERARKHLSEGKEYMIDIMSLYQGHDYQCSVERVDHSRLREGWSSRMNLLKGAIAKDMTMERTDEPKVTMIILLGSWDCVKHKPRGEMHLLFSWCVPGMY